MNHILTERLRQKSLQRWWGMIGLGLGVVFVWVTVIGLPAIAAIGKTHQVLSTPENLIWGELFKPNSKPILSVKSGDRVILQTISHEAILGIRATRLSF
ncbi:hypothetical protein ACKFKG_10805 [Phormidesmis sp. 146-35]